MERLIRSWCRLVFLFRRNQMDKDLAEEMRLHLEMKAREKREAGMSEQEARWAAQREFGNPLNLKEVSRDMWGWTSVDSILRDIHYGLRMLAKKPGFTAVAVLTLALCIGANLAIFAVVDVILVRPLPFPEADRLVAIFNSYPKAGLEQAGASFANYYNRRGSIPACSHVSAYKFDTAIIGDKDSSEAQDIMRVSPEFFATLGARPVMGRAFREEEMTFRTDRVAVLTDAYWRQHFNADPNVLGREIRENGFSKTIVGVLPSDFRFLSSEARIFFPLSSELRRRQFDSLHEPDCQMIARLKQGATLAEAQMQIDAHNATQARSDPYAKMAADAGFHTTVAPLHADHVKAIRHTLLLTQAGALFLLIIGAVNLVNLLLIRANGRAKEFAIRQSMGASRWRVVSQVMTETTLLTLAGGLFGLAVGANGIRLLSALGTSQLPLGAHITFSGRLAWIALLGAILLGFVITVPIAWFNLRGDPANALQSETRGSTSSRAAQRLRHAFIVAQIALAFILLAGAGLLGVSLKRARAVSPGFNADHILTGHISLLHKNYLNGSARITFTERLVKEVGHQPGVLATGLITSVPIRGIASSNGKRLMTVVGHTPQPGEAPGIHYDYGIAGDYFAAMGIPLRDGRFLESADSRRDQRVCVVDEDFARHYWPHGNAVGQRVFSGSAAKDIQQSFTVVGVVGVVKQTELTDDQASGAIYFPYRYDSLDVFNVFIVTRTSLPPSSFESTLQRVARNIEPELPVNDLRSMEVRIADSLVARRSPALLTGIFASAALVLAAIGTYGILAYAVKQRRREIGVRMALGALPEQIGRQFLSLGLRLLLVGTILGVFGAWMAGRGMHSILFNVPPFHLATFLGTALTLSAVTLVACLLPALRASRVDPMETLRHE
jgi:predicted permease